MNDKKDILNRKISTACEKGHLKELKILLKNDININYKDISGHTPLMLACIYGQLDVVKYLLSNLEIKKSLNIYEESDDGFNILMLACLHKQLNIVKYLLTSIDLRNTFNIYDKNDDDYSALSLAFFKGNFEIVKYLLTSPDVKNHSVLYKKDTKEDEVNGLKWVCIHGDLDMLKFLLISPELKKNFNINDKDNKGYNVLMHACEYGKFNIVKYLINDMNMNIDIDTIKWLKYKKSKGYFNKKNREKIIEFVECHKYVESN